MTSCNRYAAKEIKGDGPPFKEEHHPVILGTSRGRLKSAFEQTALGLQLSTCARRSAFDDLHRAVVVAMIAMRMMQPPLHQVIGMITVGHLLVAAAWAVMVLLVMPGSVFVAARRIGIVDGDHMFIDVIAVYMMEMTIVEVIDMAFMPNRRVAAVGTVLMGMIRMGITTLHVSPFR